MRMVRTIRPAFLLGAFLVASVSGAAQRRPIVTNDVADRPRIDVESYNLNVTIMPQDRQLRATAEIKYRQLERSAFVIFDLDNRLDIESVTLDGMDARFRQYGVDSTVEISTTGSLSDVSTLRVEYAGYFDPGGGGRGAPVLSQISPDGAFLTYESKWFPVNRIFMDKAAMTLKVTAPPDWTVISDLPASADGFSSSAQSFWGVLVAGKYMSSNVPTERGQVSVYTTTAKSEQAAPMVETAANAINFFSSTFGPLVQPDMHIVEIPDVNWTSRWGVGTLLLASSQFRSDFDAGELTQALAKQWFPLKFAVEDPVRDAWLSDGLAVFANLLFAEKDLSPADFQDRVDKTLVKALANEASMPTVEAAKLDRESPDYRALVENKGAYIFRMLQWVIGDEKFAEFLTQYVERFKDSPASTAAVTRLASEISGEDLNYFFTQWLEDSGVPEMTSEYQVYRIKDGYRTDGTIKQDLDLFRMPVELEVITDSEPEYKRVEVARQSSEFSIVTERKPREILIDPRKKILRLSPDIRVAVSINRGEEFMNEGRFNDAIDQFQDALDLDGRSSLAAFRMGEALFELNNTTPAAQNFRNVLTGDLKPKWVEVWAYINLGKIYDFRGDHERAIPEYQKAIGTGDDAYGAQAEAQKYISSPFRRGDR